MAERTLFSVVDSDDGLIQALVQSMPRSFKYHVWASPYNPSELGTVVLKYIGHIQPVDPIDTIEIEEEVRKLYGKYRNT